MELTDIHQRLLRIEKTQERIMQMFHSAIGNIKKEWGEYPEACKILNRSKEWYKKERNGEGARLIQGKDWRIVGKKIEYNLSSIEQLKESEIKPLRKVS